MTIGFEGPLYILPFDHRGSFQAGMFGWKEPLSLEQTARIADAKQVIYDGFRAAVAGGVAAKRAGVLVDEQFGSAILRDATRDGYVTAVPAEKSGEKEFSFEYGDDFARHIDKFAPTFCKVLVRYNPSGDRALNERQAVRLRHIADHVHRTGRKFMFELLVPAEKAELEELGDQAVYDRTRRPEHMVDAILQLQDAGIEPDVWKVEGLESREHCANVVAAARRRQRGGVGCIILGRGEDEQKVERWLETAASVRGFIGFAVGRTTFWDPLVAWRDGRLPRAAAVAEIARRYTRWCTVFEKAAGAAR